MLLYDVRKKNRGFTLTEMIVTVTIAGILAAISVPNLLGWYNNNQVKSALGEVEGALKEAQRQAMRRGRSCTVDLSTNAITSSDGCLFSDRILPSGVQLTTNITDDDILFSPKGVTTVHSQGTIVLSMSNASEKKCLIVSSALGIVRTGTYNGTPSSPTAANCSTSD